MIWQQVWRRCGTQTVSSRTQALGIFCFCFLSVSLSPDGWFTSIHLVFLELISKVRKKRQKRVSSHNFPFCQCTSPFLLLASQDHVLILYHWHLVNRITTQCNWLGPVMVHPLGIKEGCTFSKLSLSYSPVIPYLKNIRRKSWGVGVGEENSSIFYLLCEIICHQAVSARDVS